jgi:diaminobutyrate-2-oxoglutarate transaminase
MAKTHGLAVRGRGMMRGIDLGSGEAAAAITEACFAEGLIIETSGAHDEIVKVLAPLVIDDDLLSAGLDILERSLAAELAPTLGVAA